MLVDSLHYFQSMGVPCGVGTLAGMVVAFLLTSQITPQYTALSKVMLDPRKSRVVTDTEVVSNLDLTDQVVNSEVAVLRSNLLIERVIRDVGRRVGVRRPGCEKWRTDPGLPLECVSAPCENLPPVGQAPDGVGEEIRSG